MQVEQLLESFFTMSSKIDNIWSMYIVVHLGIFWFFFLTQRPLLFIERLIAFGAYSFFNYVNWHSLYDSYVLLKAMREDVVGRLKTSFASMPATYQAMLEVDYANLPALLYFTHVGAWVLVALFLAFRNTLINRYHKSYPEFIARLRALGD